MDFSSSDAKAYSHSRKCLLYAINGGRDELTGKQVGPANGAVQGEYLDFADVLEKFDKMMEWLAGVYVNAMNVIHYMHDNAYERLEQIDLVILDLKTWDLEAHRRLTGKDVGPTLNFARRLAERKRPVWTRFVLAPGLTDNEEDISQIAAFTAGLGNVERVDVLPFHQMGRYKWKELKIDYTLEHVEPPGFVLITRTCEQLRAYLRVVETGKQQDQ